MRVLRLLTLCLILSAPPAPSGSVCFVTSGVSSLAPWTDGEKDISVSEAMERVAAAINNNERPDIFDIDELRSVRGTSQRALMRMCWSVLGDDVNTLWPEPTDVLRKRFEFILPAVYFALGALFEQYSDSTIIFLGRDCNLLYDAAKLFTRGTEMEQKLKLLPASMDMLFSIQSMLIDRKPDIALIREYLAMAGITEEAIKSGEKFVFIDTGFEGSAADVLNKIIKVVFPDIFGKDDAGLSRTFFSRLLQASRNAQKRGLQLQYPNLNERLVRIYRSLSRINPEIYIQNPAWDIIGNFTDMNVREIAGYGMQMFPTYSGKFSKLSRDESGRMVLDTAGKREDISYYEINPTGYNREYAFVSQLLLAETVSRHLREDSYGAGYVRRAAMQNDPDLIEYAA